MGHELVLAPFLHFPWYLARIGCRKPCLIPRRRKLIRFGAKEPEPLRRMLPL
jgi:hypothetical protein